MHGPTSIKVTVKVNRERIFDRTTAAALEKKVRRKDGLTVLIKPQDPIFEMNRDHVGKVSDSACFYQVERSLGD